VHIKLFIDCHELTLVFVKSVDLHEQKRVPGFWNMSWWNYMRRQQWKLRMRRFYWRRMSW